MPTALTLGVALDCLQAGLSIIPIYADGSKSPALQKGHPVLNRQRPATDDEARKWWKTGSVGLAVLGGRISGNAECIDFDTKDLFTPWYQIASANWPGLADSLCVINSPRGWHVWYRCDEPVETNQKLAVEPVMHEGTLKVRTLIETRAEGGYCIIPGGPVEVHDTKRSYRHAEGRPLIQLAVLTAAQRQVLLAAARTFNRHCDEPRVPAKTDAESIRPGDAFNRDGHDWTAILEPHGWRCLRQHGNVRMWQRPGKDGKGISATTGACKAADGTDLFYVFSSNADPFQDRKGYSKFRAYAILNHAGNLTNAAGALKADGFGDDTINRHKPDAAPTTTMPSKSTPATSNLPGPEESFTASELMKMRLPPPRWAVNDLIPEGLGILAGRPKAGKSWLALHIAIEVATGGAVLGSTKVEAGPVLYLALEDTRRRLQNRLRKILNGPAPADLHIRLRWPRIHEGGATALRAWIAQFKPRLVIVDTLAKVRGTQRRSDDCYANDYEFIGELKTVADKESVAIMCLHHTSKSIRVDPVDEISGTLGLSGAADALLVLKRQRGEHECSLFVTGRDIEEEREISITADVANRVWQSNGSADLARISRERQEVLQMLNRSPDGLRPREIADLLGRTTGSIRVLLWRMTDDGQVRTVGGKYVGAVESRPETTPVTV